MTDRRLMKTGHHRGSFLTRIEYIYLKIRSLSIKIVSKIRIKRNSLLNGQKWGWAYLRNHSSVYLLSIFYNIKIYKDFCMKHNLGSWCLRSLGSNTEMALVSGWWLFKFTIYNNMSVCYFACMTALMFEPYPSSLITCT